MRFDGGEGDRAGDEGTMRSFELRRSRFGLIIRKSTGLITLRTEPAFDPVPVTAGSIMARFATVKSADTKTSCRLTLGSLSGFAIDCGASALGLDSLCEEPG